MGASAKNAKIILITVPIRPVPTSYPPIACTSLFDVMVDAGYSPYFYDIDALRPSFEEVVDFFKKEQPDLLLISAVVSTSYRYVKDLTHAVKKVSPHTEMILGGNLAASSEILLRKTPINLTAIGEGEHVLKNLLKHYEIYGSFADPDKLAAIKGISFLDKSGNLVFTNYEVPLAAEELRQPNYEMLAKYSDIKRFIQDPSEFAYFAIHPKAYEPHRIGQKVTTLLTAKGCVARCTFCHRWDKGYRTQPIENIVKTIKYMKEKYNVGFFTLGDENFGSDRKQVDEFIAAVKPLDILFVVSGVRVSTVDRNEGVIERLKDAGCVAMIFGMESGSPKMLQVMEKGATLEQNKRIVKQLNEQGMFTVVQLVVGMPGENEETINESMEFAKFATEGMNDLPFERLSVNYFQALPGTPGYEFGREKGIIGRTIEDEEAYLLEISDVDAASFDHYQNFSECSKERASLWARKIVREATINFFKKRNWKDLKEGDFKEAGHIKDYIRGGYFRIFKFHRSMYYWRFHDAFRWLINPTLLFRARVRLYGWPKAVLLTLRLVPEEDRSNFKVPTPASLRKIVKLEPKPDSTVSEANMIPLRSGR